MEQKTGIRSLYDEFFQGYKAEIRLFCPASRPNSTYKPAYTLFSGPDLSHQSLVGSTLGRVGRAAALGC